MKSTIKFSENLKVSNTAPSRTPHRLTLCKVLPVRFCLALGIFSPALTPAPAPLKSRLSTIKIFSTTYLPCSLLEIIHFLLSSVVDPK